MARFSLESIFHDTPKTDNAPIRAMTVPKLVRIFALAAADVGLVCLSSFLALFMRHEFSMTLFNLSGYWPDVCRFLPVSVCITLVVYAVLHLYDSLWAYAGARECLLIVIAEFFCAVFEYAGMQIFRIFVPRSFPCLYFLLMVMFTVALRLSYRLIRQAKVVFSGRLSKRTMLIGAGSAGATVLREMATSMFGENQVVCIIDDDPVKKGSRLNGVPVVGGREKIKEAVEHYNVSEIIYAIPSASGDDRRAILSLCQETGCKVRALPGIYQLTNGEVSVQQLREVDITDLLGRDEVRVDLEDIRGYLAGKTVLVTGGGGSIGSELCRQIARSDVGHLIIFDIYENNAYDIQQELLRTCPGLRLTVLIGSVRDRTRVEQIFRTYLPDIVFHAAAHKHVPLMEDSPAEAIKNNVFGTLNTAECARDYGCAKFILISTDKAVNPTSVMGASKRICEMVLQYVSGGMEPCDFASVRFGNVLGSNGSVIPLFRKQIREGGPVTVTDKNIIRYFMTIPEAVTLVLQAGAYAETNQIFILDMGEPVRIDDLARRMIRLSGLEPDVDIKVVYTGLRPGEKLYEEILMDSEGKQKTANNLIYIGQEDPLDPAVFARQLETLRTFNQDDGDGLRQLISEIVPTCKFGLH